MIDFRYHLVSIIAVFLALAVGILVGAAYLSVPAERLLQAEQQKATSQNGLLRARNDELNRQVGADQAFAQANSDRIVSGLLTGQGVVLVEAPGLPDGMAAGVIATLDQAGATVTGEIVLQPNFLAAGGQTESSLTQVAGQAATQAGVSLPATSLYPGVAGQQQAAAVIAAAIVSKTGAGLAPSTSQGILSDLANAGFLSEKPGKPNTLGSATLAVLLTPAGTQPSAASDALAAFAAELKSASAGTVMAGALSPVNASNAISVEAGSGIVSTVDNADTSSGQIFVAQVLKLLLNGKQAAAYGAGPGTAPSPAPTPSATSGSTTAHSSATRSPSAGMPTGSGQ